MLTSGASFPTRSLISYAPSVQDTGDKEAATKVITATAEATGVGNADYSHALTLAAPSDSRLAVQRITARLSFTIDSFDVATILYCRVYVDAQDADHLLIDTSHNAASNTLVVQATGAATKAVIFNLLKDGAAHTFYFFFWVNQATSATISLVELWEGVGTAGTEQVQFMALTFSGWVNIIGYYTKQGTGAPLVEIRNAGGSTSYADSQLGSTNIQYLATTGLDFRGRGTVATDLNYLRDITLALEK